MSTDEMKGKTKEAAGVLTDDDDLKREGRNDQRAGEAKDKLHDAEDWVEDKIDDARDRLDRNDKKARLAVEHARERRLRREVALPFLWDEPSFGMKAAREPGAVQLQPMLLSKPALLPGSAAELTQSEGSSHPPHITQAGVNSRKNASDERASGSTPNRRITCLRSSASCRSGLRRRSRASRSSSS